MHYGPFFSPDTYTQGVRNINESILIIEFLSDIIYALTRKMYNFARFPR